jgi:hypothetical protein
MYVRRIEVKGRTYYQLVDAFRYRGEKGRVHTQYLAPMGRHPTPQAAMDEYSAELDRLRGLIQRTEAQDRRMRKLSRWARKLSAAVAKEVEGLA